MSAATFPLPDREWKLRLPLSLTASAVIHLLLIASAALLLRAMPSTVGRSVPSMALSATLLTLPPLHIEAPLPLPLMMPAEPMHVPLPLPVAPPLRSTQSPGVSSAPATIQVQAQFVPVGRTSYGIGNGRRRFGDSLAAQMAARFPASAARAPRLNGSLSMLYPLKGAQKGKSLSLSALLMIDGSGRITEARVLPDDEPAFVAAVLEALKYAAFYPAQLDGKPIPYWTVLDFNFVIDGPTGADGKHRLH